MYWSEVTPSDSGAVVAVLNGCSRTITLENGATPRLVDGWRPRGCYGGMSPFFLVELCNDVGEFALWIVDGEGRLHCNETMLDPRRVSTEIAEAIRAHFSVVAARLIATRDAVFDPAIRDFFRLSVKMRRRLFGVLPQDFLADLNEGVKDLATPGGTNWTVSTPQGGVELSRDRILGALQPPVHERWLDACRRRKLTWPMLTGDGLCDDVRCLFFAFDVGV
jgi:hypothetical protein